MKDWLKYSALWQNKRNEWLVEDDPTADWQHMQSLLDEQLPNPAPTTGSGGNSAGMGSNFLKLWIVLLITVPAAIALYFLLHNGNPQLKKQPANTSDSLSALAKRTDSIAAAQLAVKDKIIAYDDSIRQVRQQLITTGSTLTDMLSADNKNAKINDSIAVIRHRLAAANRRLPQLLNARNAIAAQDKQTNGKGGAGSSPQLQIAGGGAPASNKINIPNGIKDGAMITTGANKHKADKKPEDDVNASTNNKKTGDTGNSLTGNSTSAKNAGDNGNYPFAGNAPGLWRGNAMDILTAINGYHPDKDVFGTIVTQGNYPFKNSLRPGDMRYKGRVFATGSSKIKVYKPEKPKKGKKIKEPGDSGDSTSKFDWGLLAGVNVNGSFSRKSQNANIYGSLPIDMYTGAFGTYHFSHKFGLHVQSWLLNPLNMSGGYSHVNGSKFEKSQLIQVTDSRKVYFATVPLQLIYRVAGNFSVKAGPVFNLPVKQTNAVTSITPIVINKDTVYYRGVITQLNATKYDKKINFGLSGGLQIQTGRMMFDATYQKSLNGYKIISDFGTYANNPGVLQFTVGLRLNRGRR
jgi:hypothetical protein